MSARAVDDVVGLRVDVDTFRGTRDGVPALLAALRAEGIRASFFFSLGPDNMGRHLWRLGRPKFLLKMLRSNAPSLYGWDVALQGTFWPGRHIAPRLADVIRRTADEGHEVGLHAWDHHLWQSRLERMSLDVVREQLELGYEALERILGVAPTCSATAGWKCDERVLLEKERLGFRYNSDCRGASLFRPVVDGRVLAPQVPVSLPTYDECVGRDGVADSNYNAQLLERLDHGGLRVLTIHAEVEGLSRRALWHEFLREARQHDWTFAPLGELLAKAGDVPRAGIGRGTVPGREGWLCVQAGGSGV